MSTEVVVCDETGACRGRARGFKKRARGAEGRTANRGSFRLRPWVSPAPWRSRTGGPTLRRSEKGLFDPRFALTDEFGWFRCARGPHVATRAARGKDGLEVDRDSQRVRQTRREEGRRRRAEDGEEKEHRRPRVRWRWAARSASGGRRPSLRRAVRVLRQAGQHLMEDATSTTWTIRRARSLTITAG